MKEHLRGEGFESEDDTNTAVTATLHRLSKHEHKAAIDRLPHGWENVRTVLVRTLRTYAVNTQEYQYCCYLLFLLQQKHTQNLCNDLRTCAMYGGQFILHVPVALRPEQKRRSVRSILEKNL